MSNNPSSGAQRAELTLEELDSLYEPELDDLEDAPYEVLDEKRNEALEKWQEAHKTKERIAEELEEADTDQEYERIEERLEPVRQEETFWEDVSSRAAAAIQGWFAMTNHRDELIAHLEAEDAKHREGGGGGGQKTTAEMERATREWVRNNLRSFHDLYRAQQATNRQLAMDPGNPVLQMKARILLEEHNRRPTLERFLYHFWPKPQEN